MTLLLPRSAEPVPVLLMNTIWADGAGTHDALTSTEDLAAWLDAVAERVPVMAASAQRGRPGKSDLAQFRRLRDALRDVAAEIVDDPRSVASNRDAARAVPELNEASAAAPSWPRLRLRPRTTDPVVPAGTRPAAAARSAIAAEAIGLFAIAETSLRACLAPGCVLYFVKDHPRREWCSATCGNRARAARHYERHRRAARV
jgi:predicted RNA-binding Zn ribbon-like protein